jgi:hypothetical protein
MTKVLICEQCPECGSPDYITLHSDWSAAFRVALVYDRRCAECGAAYRPPAPWQWAAAATALGPFIAAGSVAAAVYIARYPGVDEAWIRWGLAGVFLVFAACGIAFLRQGVRGLHRRPPVEQGDDEQ